MSEGSGDWPAVQLDLLRRLWNEGMVSQVIADELSKVGPARTKNAVLGKVHRLKLVGRQSPIQPKGPKKAPPRKRPPSSPPPVAKADRPRPPAPAPAEADPERELVEAAGATSAQDQAAVAETAKRGAAPPQFWKTWGTPQRTVDQMARAVVAAHARRMAAPAVLSAPLASVPFQRFRTCQWPQGEPGTEGFRFCGDPAEPGRRTVRAAIGTAYVKPVRAA